MALHWAADLMRLPAFDANRVNESIFVLDLGKARIVGVSEIRRSDADEAVSSESRRDGFAIPQPAVRGVAEQRNKVSHDAGHGLLHAHARRTNEVRSITVSMVALDHDFQVWDGESEDSARPKVPVAVMQSEFEVGKGQVLEDVLGEDAGAVVARDRQTLGDVAVEDVARESPVVLGVEASDHRDALEAQRRARVEVKPAINPMPAAAELQVGHWNCPATNWMSSIKKIPKPSMKHSVRTARIVLSNSLRVIRAAQ